MLDVDGANHTEVGLLSEVITSALSRLDGLQGLRAWLKGSEAAQGWQRHATKRAQQPAEGQQRDEGLTAGDPSGRGVGEGGL